MNISHRFLFVLFLYILMLGNSSCSEQQDKAIALPFYNSPDMSPKWEEAGDINSEDFHRIAAFELVNQLGDTIQNEDLEGKIYLANFFFTICPGICIKMTNNMNRIQEAFRDDDKVVLLSHSVMPWVDTVAQLRQYADVNNIIDGKWHLLTGEAADINVLARTSYFAEKELGYQKKAEEFLHTENIVLVDYQGRLRGIYNGTIPLEMQRIIKDVRTLKDEML